MDSDHVDALVSALRRREIACAPGLTKREILAASPCTSGNPVFSVYQTDIIHYGLDLSAYLTAEFGAPNPFPVPAAPREIPFWSELERLDG